MEVNSWLFVWREEVKLKLIIPLKGWTGPDCSRNFMLQISSQSAHEVGRVVNAAHRPPLLRINFCYSFLLENSCADGRILLVTPSEIELTILLAVARCLKQMRYRMPRKHLRIADISWEIRNEHIPNTYV
jgi:hypothetical protein